jgi:hypothetical protein
MLNDENVAAGIVTTDIDPTMVTIVTSEDFN